MLKNNAQDKSSMLLGALQMSEAKIKVIALQPNAKVPISKGFFDTATHERSEIEAFATDNPGCNFGVVTGEKSGIFVLDVDGEEGRKSLQNLMDNHGKLPSTFSVLTYRGTHLYFQTGKHEIRCSVGKLGPGLDIRGDGGYVVAPGSKHPEGAYYEYADGRDIEQIEIAPAPAWLLGLVVKKSVSPASDVVTTKPPDRERAYIAAVVDKELAVLSQATEGQRNISLNIASFKLGQWAYTGTFVADDLKSKLRQIALQIGLEAGEIDATIQSGWKAGMAQPRQLQLESPTAKFNDSQSALTTELAGLGDTDADNASRFLRRYAHCVVYTPSRGWMVYQGGRWQRDSLAKHKEFADETMRQIVGEVEHTAGNAEKLAKRAFAVRCLSNGARNRMLEMVQHRLTVPDEKFDSHPFLLNVASGTINLIDGQLRSHNALDYITHYVDVKYDAKSLCPLFKKTLKHALKGDKQLVSFVQRAVGYSLTGDTKEQRFFFLFGPGNTSKSTFINTVRTLLKSYGKHTPVETLLAKKFEGTASNDLARLQGARMVTAVEANSGRELDEAKIKSMTGGEPITSRFLYREFFEFQPEFKLWLASNFYPKVSDTSEAFWRRPCVIPFSVVITKDSVDGELPRKLEKEFPGILAWAVRGAVFWQKHGLKAPKAVKQATKCWRLALDHVERFVRSCCVTNAEDCEKSQQVFDCYSTWCDSNGESPMSMSKFKGRMESLKFIHVRTNTGSHWKGFKLKA